MFNVLDSQEAVYFGCVGWIFFSPKLKWLCSVHDPADLETALCPVALAVGAVLGGEMPVSV